MAVRVYADAEALAAYPGGTTVSTDDADALLRAASRVVDQLMVAQVYAVDSDGLPTDTDVAQAFSDAACAIAIECAATGATTPGQTRQWASIGIGSVSLSGRQPSADSISVLGVPVPALALLALAGVGCTYVSTEALPWWTW